MSRARMDFDDPAAGVALTAKGDLDAERPQRCLHAPQATGERPGISGPDGAIRANSVPPVSGAGPEQVGGAAHPVLRSAMISRTQAATGAASMASTIAVLRLAA
jgi:hypothetical protein